MQGHSTGQIVWLLSAIEGPWMTVRKRVIVSCDFYLHLFTHSCLPSPPSEARQRQHIPEPVESRLCSGDPALGFKPGILAQAAHWVFEWAVGLLGVLLQFVGHEAKAVGACEGGEPSLGLTGKLRAWQLTIKIPLSNKLCLFKTLNSVLALLLIPCTF